MTVDGSRQLDRFAGRDYPQGVIRVLGDLHGKVDGDVLALGCSPTGLLNLVEDRGVFRRFDSQTGSQVDSIPLGDSETTWVISPDGLWLASAGQALTVWKITETPEPVWSETGRWTTAGAFSPDSTWLAIGHDHGSIEIWNVQNGTKQAHLRGPSGAISALAFSPDGFMLASANESRIVSLWNWQEEKLVRTLTGHTDRIDALAWSRTGHRLASAAWDTAVRIWDPKTGHLLALLNGHGERVHCVQFLPPDAPEGQLVSGDCENVVRIWDYESLKLIQELNHHRGAVKHVVVGTGAQFLATAGDDRSVIVWDGKTLTPRFGADGPMTDVTAMAINGSVVGSVHSERCLAWWNFSTGEMRSCQNDQGYSSITCSVTGIWAAGTVEGTIRLFHDLGSQSTKAWTSDVTPVGELAFNRIGNTLITSHRNHGTLRFWDVDTTELVLVVPQASLGGNVESLCYHPSDGLLAVAGVDWKDGRTVDGDALVAEWRRRTPAKIPVVETRHAFHPDGAIVLWDTELWAVRQVLDGGGRKVRFHPSGKTLASISMDYSVLIWDPYSGELLHELTPSRSAASDIVFDPNGVWLCSCGRDGTLQFWDCATWKRTDVVELDARMTSMACSDDGRYLVAGMTNGASLVIETAEIRSH